ncbi:MAG: CYTH and CHAD domain-containing protein [Rhodovibrionaceae bacterium]
MNDEIELKLSLAPEHLERLRRNPLLRSLAQGRSKRQELVSTYFDTPDFKLKSRGQALRIRQIGERRVQTLKAKQNGAQPGVSMAHSHREFENDVDGEQPRLDLIDDDVLRAELEQPQLRDALTPVFTTQIDRRALALHLADSDIELAIDFGEIRANGRNLPICEAELELKSGRPSRLYELALLLCDKIPFRIEQQTKAARGYGLYGEHEPEPVFAVKQELSPELTTGEAFARLARACLDHLRANEAAVFHGADPEGVHQMRVATRRLRALVSAFQDLLDDEVGAELKRELRWLQQVLGPARDWDVFTEETLAPLLRSLPGEAGLEDLRDHCKRARAQAYEAAHQALAEPRYTRLLLRLALWLGDGGWASRDPADEAALKAPVQEWSDPVLDRRAAGLAKLGRKHRKLSHARLHQVRIAAKKMRYACEFFRGIYDEKALKTYIKRLVALQDTLGSLNDAVTGHRLLDEIESSLGRNRRGAMATPVGIVMGWQAAQIDNDLGRFSKAWKKYRGTKVFWD